MGGSEFGPDAFLYRYWPSPRRRRQGAPPAAVVVNDLAFRLRPAEVPWQQRAYFGTVLGPALRQAAAVVVPTETTRRDLLAAYPMAGLDERVTVIPYGFRAPAAAGSLPDGIRPGFILAVGTIEPRKNYPRLLAAYRLLRQRGSVPQLVIAGRPGWAYGDTLDRIKSEPGVLYLGHVDEPTLAALYENASVLALPSLYEGFGLPLLEAMARGVPAVIGKTAALPELAGRPPPDADPQDPEPIPATPQNVLSNSPFR